jgi:hypothetical protein
MTCETVFLQEMHTFRREDYGQRRMPAEHDDGDAGLLRVMCPAPHEDDRDGEL